MTGSDTTFAGAVPRVYSTYLAPLLFEPYAGDLAARAASRDPARILEIAAGTGVLTRALASGLPERASIVATDLNRPMLDEAEAGGTARPVEWREADAMRLPFPDASFDCAVCQFGVMFFPDRPRAFAEARRVLEPGGAFLFNTWDRIEENGLAAAVQEALQELFPGDPPRFMERVPHGYHDPAQIERDLAQAGFGARPRIEPLALRSRARSAREAAVAFCRGTPLWNELQSRGAAIDAAVEAAEAAIARRFGRGEVDAGMRAFVVAVER